MYEIKDIIILLYLITAGWVGLMNSLSVCRLLIKANYKEVAFR